MLLAPEQSEFSIQDDVLVVHRDGEAIEIHDDRVLGVSVQFQTDGYDTVNDRQKNRRVVELQFTDQSERERNVFVSEDDIGYSNLLEYASRVAKPAAKNAIRELVQSKAVSRKGVTINDEGILLVASGETVAMGLLDLVSIDEAEDLTLLWRQGELEPCAVIRMDDPNALMLREMFRELIRSDAQQTDWIPADQEFFQMVGTIDCSKQSVAVNPTSMIRLGGGLLGIAAALVMHFFVDQIPFMAIAAAVMTIVIGCECLARSVNRNKVILAVFRRGLTLMDSAATGDENDSNLSWLDIDDAKLEVRFNNVERPEEASSMKVDLQLKTRADHAFGKSIALTWEAPVTDNVALAYLSQQLEKRVWKRA